MTAPDEAKASARTDQQLADALLEGVQAQPVQSDGDEFDESAVMTGGTRVDEIRADRDVILRDKVTNKYFLSGLRSGREPAPLSIGRESLDEARHAFVAPAGFAESVVKERFVLIRVAAGRGGGSAAIRMLLDSGATTIKELASDVALGRLNADNLEPRSGYLLRNAAVPVLDELTDFEITRLGEVLGDLDCRLVVTADPRVSFPESLLGRYAVEIGEPPDAHRVLEAHLRRRLRRHDPDGGRATEILADAAVLDMLADSAHREDRVARAASFARILADAERAGDFDLRKIQAQLKRITDVSFEIWFDGLDFADRCFAIALAALPGYSYEIVSGAAAALEKALRPLPPPAPGSVPDDPFAARRSRRLDTVLARVSSRSVVTRYGVTPMEVVAFIDPSLARQILERVWTEHADIRPILLEWLRDLATHNVLTVREGAARAVGVLAVQAFDYVRRYVIGQWGQSSNPWDRQAAASALLAPARESAVSLATRRMLYDWHLDRSDASLRNTAARAYGQVGVVDVEEALDALGHLATGVDLTQVISNSVTLLIVHGDEAVALHVLRRLHEWTGSPAVDPPSGSVRAVRGMTRQEELDDQRARMFTAYAAFLGSAVDAKLVNPVDDRPDAVAWHGLLWLADRNDEIAATVSALWGLALDSQISRDAARDVLTVWAVRIDGDSCGREAFARLLGSAAARSNRARNTLLTLARSWKTNRDPLAPLAAEAVLATLAHQGDNSGTIG